MEKNVFSGFGYRLHILPAVTLIVLATRVCPWFALLATGGAVWWLNLAAVGAGLALHADLLHARKWSLRCLVFTSVVPLVELLTWWRACLLAVARGSIAWRDTRYRLAELREAHDRLATRGR